MPSRCATSAATVDLPVPVEPPISRHDRHVERLQVGIAGAAGRPHVRASSLAEHLARELVEPLDLDRRDRRARPDRARSAAPAGRRGRPARRRRSARAPSAPSNTEARRRRAAAARRACAASCHDRHQRRGAARRARARRPRCAASTTLHAVRERMLDDDVDRRGLQLDQICVGCARGRARSASRSARLRRDVDDVGVEVRRRRGRRR